MNKSVFEAIIGAIILLFVTALIYFISINIRDDDGKYYKVIAYFDDISGLSIGSHVTISGIKIGEVISASFDYEKRAAKVEMCIKEEIKLPRDSSVKITSAGLMSDKLVKIDLGSSDGVLDVGGEIEYTQSAGGIESLLSKFIFS